MINAFNPAGLEEKKLLDWEMTLEDKELALKTAVWRLYNIAGKVSTMECEVAEQADRPSSGKIGDGLGAWWNDSATTNLKVTADLSGKLTKYTALKVGDEIVVVSAVNNDNTINVYARWFGSSTAAAHADQVDALIIGYNMIQGVKDIESYITGESTRSYYVAKNTIPAVSYTKENLTEMRKLYGKEGMTNYVDAQINVADRDLLVKMNRSVIYSSGSKPTLTSPWMVVGLIEEAMTRGNIVATFGAISSVAKINSALTASRNKGWFADVMVCWPNSYDDIQKLANSEVTVTVPARLQLVLGASVASIQTKVGSLVPVLDLEFPDDKIIICNSADLFWSAFEWFELPWADRTLAQESTRNDQAFTVDSISQGTTWYLNTNKNCTILTGVTHSSS